MLIPLQDIIILYEKIIAEINISQISIIIFTSVDPDSLCTYKILARLFQSQSIYFKVYPVTTYTQFDAKIQDAKAFKQVKLFFFINCGGITDLTQKWFIDTAQVFLIDINKPIHHKNIQHPKIRVIDDGKSDLHQFPTSEDFQMLQELQQCQIDQEDNDYQSESSQQGSPKRKSNYSFSKQIKKRKKILENKITSYYGRQYFSMPSSYIAYNLVKDMNKLNNDFLWYGIVGVTTMYLQQRLAKEVFDRINNIYGQDMLKLNVKNGNRRQKGSIQSKIDFQFTLMRHWSLYQSMMNSTYMITKLKLWTQNGRKQLDQLLTLIGIPLVQAKQLYKYMPRQSKQKLKNSIFVYAQRFQILQVAYHSFFRQVQSSSKLMASDYSFALICTLQKPQKKADMGELFNHRVAIFWEASELLDAPEQKVLTKISQFKQISQRMTNLAQNLVERDHIIKANSFYFVNIQNDTQERKSFEHPYALIRLAYLLMGIQKERKKLTYPKPFIASLQNVENNQCTVVGVMGEAKNYFGPKFLQVSSKLKIDVKHDSFLANIMTLPKNNLLEFIKQLGVI